MSRQSAEKYADMNKWYAREKLFFYLGLSLGMIIGAMWIMLWSWGGII